MKDPEARALYLFPTKALAQDQLQNLQGLVSQLEEWPAEGVARETAKKSSAVPSQKSAIVCAVYDGDTPTGARAAIRGSARLVLSNPDMLHTGILPHHTSWSVFFRSLQFVVIDEMHIYRGVFGSHVANVLRRLKRTASFYGASPQFILTSATISNPVELAEGLIEEPVSLVDQDGSARGPKSFLIYNPPIVNRDLGLRRSALQESVRLASDLLDENIQTIIFGRSRRTVEII
jgi:DEAD/DEAH box helicase domain-containing protein